MNFLWWWRLFICAIQYCCLYPHVATDIWKVSRVTEELNFLSYLSLINLCLAGVYYIELHSSETFVRILKLQPLPLPHKAAHLSFLTQVAGWANRYESWSG